MATQGPPRNGPKRKPTRSEQQGIDVLCQLLALPPEALANFQPQPLPPAIKGFITRRANRGQLQSLLVEVLARLRKQPRARRPSRTELDH